MQVRAVDPRWNRDAYGAEVYVRIGNRWLMQFQADILGVPVLVPEVAETTAFGAAQIASVGIGAQTLSDIGRGGDPKATYEPQMGEDERATLLDGWHRALERSRGWVQP